MAFVGPPPNQFPQQQQYILQAEPQNQDKEYLIQNKFRSAKGLLMCLLAIPILFFVTCLVLFVIMICHQHSSTVSVDRAISTTEQFGVDLNSKPIRGLKISKDKCGDATAGSNDAQDYKLTNVWAQFQGIDSGNTNQITAGTEYQEVDVKSQCTDKCKKEPGIQAKDLTIGHYYTTGTGSSLVKNYNKVCYQTVDFDKFVMKTDNRCPTTGYADCATANTKSSLFCKKTGTGDAAGHCPFINLKEKTEAADKGFFTSTKGIEGETEVLTTSTDKKNNQVVIGIVGGFDRPCKNPEYFPALPKSRNYPLLAIEYSECDEYGSYDKVQAEDLYLTGVNYYTFLNNNGLQIDDVTKSPYFKDFINHADFQNKYKFYTKHRANVKFDDVCQPAGMQDLGLIRKYLNSTNRALFVYTLIGLVLSALGVLFWLVLIGSTFTATRRKSKKSSSQLLKVMHIIAIILAILLIVFYVHYFSVADEDFDKINTTHTMLEKAGGANCYDNAGNWKTAVDKVQDFIWTSLKISKPFIIAFFIIGIVYLAIVLLVMAATKAKGVSPCYPPYLNYVQ